MSKYIPEKEQKKEIGGNKDKLKGKRVCIYVTNNMSYVTPI